MGDNNKDTLIKSIPQLLFKAEVIDNKIIITRNTEFIPALSYVSKCLDTEIIELIIQEKMKKKMEQGIIQKVANKIDLNNFLRRK